MKSTFGKMKRSSLLILWLVFFGTATAGMMVSVPRPDPLDRAKLEEVLKQVDRADVGFYLPRIDVEGEKVSNAFSGIQTGIVTDDKVWLNEFTTLLRSIDGKAEWITPSLDLNISTVHLYHGENVLLHLMWADEKRLIIYTPDGSWSVELYLDQDVVKQFVEICAKKKPAVGIELYQKSQPLKIELPKIDPRSLKIELPNQSAKPTTASGPRG